MPPGLGVEEETFQSLWDDAFDVYEDRTGIDLRHENTDLALRLQGCDSAASVLDILQKIASQFAGYREGSPKWRKFRWKLKPVITVIAAFIDAAADGATSMPVPGGSAVFVAIGVLLKATQGVSEKFDALIDLLESLELFFRQLSIRSDVPLGKESKHIVVEILVEMLKALALATQMMKQNRIRHFVRELVKGDDMKAILDRIQKLTTIESRMSVAEILGMVNQASGVLGEVNRTTSSLERQNQDILAHLSMLPFDLERQVAAMMEKNMKRLSEEVSASIVTQTHAASQSLGLRLDTTQVLPSTGANTYLDLFYRTIRALIAISREEQVMMRRDMTALLPVITTTSFTAAEGSAWALSGLAAAINPTTAIGLYAQTMVLYVVAYVVWRLISKGTSALLSAPDIDTANTIVLIDLVGIEMRLPLERCATFEDFHRLLIEHISKERRKNVSRYVLSRAYEVNDVSNSAVVYPHVWERRIRAGMKLDMTAVVYRPFVACPWCGRQQKAALWIYCECDRTYQASAASLTEPQDNSRERSRAFIEELESETSSSGSEESLNPRARAEEDVEDHSDPVYMASLRKVHVIFDDSDGSKIHGDTVPLQSLWPHNLSASAPEWPHILPEKLRPHRWIDGDAPPSGLFFDIAPVAFGRALQYDPTELSVPGGSVATEDELIQPAFDPPITALRILHPQLPLWPVDIVSPSDDLPGELQPISLGDVLVTLHRALHTPITSKEWETLDAADANEVATTFTERFRAEAKEIGLPSHIGDDQIAERNKGVKRVDFLLGNTLLKGFRRESGDPEGCMRMVTTGHDESAAVPLTVPLQRQGWDTVNA